MAQKDQRTQQEKEGWVEVHNIDTETFRCNCGAPMCRECGGCSAQCDCKKAVQK